MGDFQRPNDSHGVAEKASDRLAFICGAAMPPRYLVALSLITVFLGFAGAAVFLHRNSAGAMLIFVASVLLAIMELQTYFQFFADPKPSCIGLTGPRDFVAVISGSALMAILIEAGTLIGAATASPLVLSDWRIKRLIAFFFIVYAIALLLLEYVPVDISARARKHFYAAISKKSLFVVAAYLLAFVLSIAIAHLCFLSMGLSFVPQFAFWLFVCFSLATFALHFGFRAFSYEFAVMFMILVAGSSIILAVPISNLYSWDDEVHYSNALNLSYFSDVELSSSDIMLTRLFDVQQGHTLDASMNRFPVDASLTWRDAEIAALKDELDAGFARGPIQVHEGISSGAFSYTSLGYLPSAAGLWLGRLLHMPLSSIFMLGRFGNLVSYAFICYFAIRLIPCKKYLMGTLALLPTSVFMAANYAYDPWVISFGFLSIALIVRTLSSKGRLSGHVVFAIALSFLLGLAPKAVYFPLIGLMSLIPTEQLSPKARHAFYLFVVVLGSIVVASFLVPLVVSNGGGAGDVRGGEGVNSSEQVRYILHNPGAYASTMINFLLTGYLTPGSFGSATIQWAYLSDLSVSLPGSAYVVLGFVLLVSLFDSDSVSKKLVSVRGALWTLFLVGVAIIGICTALYLSFTPVALDWINGVQPRYLLPLLFPLFVFVLNVPIKWKWHKRLVPAVTLFSSGVLLAFTSWMLLFSRLLA